MNDSADISSNYDESLLEIPLPPEEDSDASIEHMNEKPIKMSIFSSKDGKYHLKYDDYVAAKQDGFYNFSSPEDEDFDDMNCALPSKRKYNRKTVKSTKLVKPSTETLYEIDLFCEACNHDYKSLMSLNRHKRTRKHLNQVAKLNESGKRPAKFVERDWSNYESYLSTYELMPREVYNSIVQTLLEDTESKVNGNQRLPANNARAQTPRKRDRNVPESYLNNDKHDFFHSSEYDEASKMYNSMPSYEMNALQPEFTQISPFKCSVCYEYFPTLENLESHIEKMSLNCSAIFNSTDAEHSIDESFT